MTTATDTGSASSLVFFHAQTPLHPGAGTALGVVDLPVQRERHTRWPTLPGSSIKGVFRDAFRRRHEDATCITVFGPETGKADEHAGAVSITDARILAFPVRSLKGVFAYATSRAVLERLRRDLKLVDSSTPFELPPRLDAGHAYCAADSPLKLDQEHLVLEEFDLQVDAWNAFPSLAQQLAQWVSDDAPFQQDFAAQLVILDDDQFTHFVRHGTEVVARIGLDYATKTVRTGALFYQEFLPAETILYSLVLASPARDGSDLSAADILQRLQSGLPNVLQFGGDETTGKGFCHVHFAS